MFAQKYIRDQSATFAVRRDPSDHSLVYVRIENVRIIDKSYEGEKGDPASPFYTGLLTLSYV